MFSSPVKEASDKFNFDIICTKRLNIQFIVNLCIKKNAQKYIVDSGEI